MLQPRTNVQGKNVEEGTKVLEGTVPLGVLASSASFFSGVLIYRGTLTDAFKKYVWDICVNSDVEQILGRTRFRSLKR